MRQACFLLVFMFAWPCAAEGLDQVQSVRQTALGFFATLRAGDGDKAQGFSLSYGQWAAVSKRRLDEERFNKEQRSFVRKLAGALKRGARLEEPVLQDVLVLPAGAKRKAKVVMAVFHGKLSWSDVPGRGQSLVFCFLQVDGVWRFWHRS